MVWSLREPERLSSAMLAALTDDASDIFVSPISFYEIEVKRASGKWDVEPMDEWPLLLQDSGVSLLSFLPEHAIAAARLPAIHKDPWDRLLVASAILSGMTIVTQDKALSRYSVKTLS